MKKLLGLLAISPMMIAGCSGGNSYDISISSYGSEYLQEGDAWHKWLEKETGLKIKVVQHDDNEQLEASLKTTDFDIIMPSEYMVHKLAESDQLEEIDWEKISSSRKDEVEKYSVASISSLETLKVNGSDKSIIDYAMGYAMGDLKYMINTTNNDCMDAVVASDSTINAKEDIVDGISLSTSVLFDKTVNNVCKTELIDDARNVALIAALNIQGESGTSKNADELNNPEVNDDLKDEMKKLKDAGAKFIEDENLSYNYSIGETSLVLSYGTDPLWIFDDSDAKVTRKETVTMNISGHSNLWIDMIAMTSGATEDAYKVFDVMMKSVDQSSAVDNWYNSPYSEIEEILKKEVGDDKAFDISTIDGYYGIFNYKKGTNKNYNDEVKDAYFAAKA